MLGICLHDHVSAHVILGDDHDDDDDDDDDDEDAPYPKQISGW